MKKIVLAMAFLALAAGVALAGPNAGLTLTPHGNWQGVETNGVPCDALWDPPPATCQDLVPNALPDLNNVDWFLAVAAGKNMLGIQTIVFGLGDYNNAEAYTAGFGPCFAALVSVEVPSSDLWPAPNTGTAVSWSPNCLTGMLIPVYYFGFYVYGDEAVPMGDFYPGQPASVVSCTQPPEEDPIEDPDGDGKFGIMGVGADPGKQECPPPQIEEGACCNKLTGECILVLEEECPMEHPWYWDGTPSCDPNPCVVTPTKETTWGQIKSIYR